MPPESRRRHAAGGLCVITGVAGSGKSSLILGSVAGRDGVVIIDQVANRGSRRSNPATYAGLLDPIRKAFAKANGVKPVLFSASSEGACPACTAPASSTPTCDTGRRGDHLRAVRGARFQASVLEYRLGGRDLSEVLAMPVTEAEKFCSDG